MGSTTSRGYPYPFAADTNNVPADLLALANAINTDVGTVAAAKVDAATVGNLLTASQATGSEAPTNGVNTNCTLTVDGTQYYEGTTSLLMTSAAAGMMASKYFAITIPAAGTYTVFCRVRTDQPVLGLIISSTGTGVTSDNAKVAAGNTGWTNYVSVITTTQATTLYLYAATTGTYGHPTAAGQKLWLDTLGVWTGAGGTWALPGTPIANLGFYTDESVGRRLYQWDANNNRFQMTYGDTGLRDVTAALGNSSHFTINNADLRRVGSTVEFYCDFTTTASYVAGDNLWTVPSGFQPEVSRYGLVYFYASSVAAIYTGGTLPLYSLALSTTYRVHGTWTVTQAWPTTLPGVAVGSIPQ